MLKRIIVSGIMVAVSYCMVKYRKQIGDMFYPISFAEKYLGAGGTYSFFILLGIGIFIIALMYGTGSLDIFFQENVTQFFGEKASESAS